MQSRPLLTLHQHPYRSLGGLDDLEHMAHRADLVEILLLWLGDADLPAASPETDDGRPP